MSNISIDGTLLGGVPNLSNAETASTGSTLSAGRPSVISSTAAQALALPAPAAGLVKMICKTSSSTAVQTVSATLGGVAATIGDAGVTLTFTAGNQAIILGGLSASKWAVLSNSGVTIT